MRDPRVDEYARLLVDRCLGVRAGWHVLVASSPLARPLVEAALREIGRRGAYAVTSLQFAPAGPLREVAWAQEAAAELVAEPAPLERALVQGIDAALAIEAPENVYAEAALERDRLDATARAMQPLTRRLAANEIPWVVCHYPTDALAQQAGMPLAAFADTLFAACLIDWDALSASMAGVAERLTAAREARIVAPGTDLRLSLEGRPARVDDGRVNMPGGEVYVCPVEDSAEGSSPSACRTSTAAGT